MPRKGWDNVAVEDPTKAKVQRLRGAVVQIGGKLVPLDTEGKVVDVATDLLAGLVVQPAPSKSRRR
jgi:hypothetical protein